MNTGCGGVLRSRPLPRFPLTYWDSDILLRTIYFQPSSSYSRHGSSLKSLISSRCCLLPFFQSALFLSIDPPEASLGLIPDSHLLENSSDHGFFPTVCSLSYPQPYGPSCSGKSCSHRRCRASQERRRDHRLFYSCNRLVYKSLYCWHLIHVESVWRV
ncbi:hypothetical protein BCR34DRAFT_277937 [Clohesyomyces aquaticus]|uniref:Uncharacterized protein n=1 Tax=Clohesyomyces aquaticus TaxID=1231657 RepID=A0A1Y1ZRZ6_9PLEO|nr:hypothetical protein BCR34DRAFT_277937 [Clohesyomyces aquaticus]